MADRSTTPATTRLARLGAQLASRGMEVTFPAQGLQVTNPGALCGCGHRIGDTITYRPHSEAKGIYWFFTSWGEAIGPGSDIDGATRRILEYLVQPHMVSMSRSPVSVVAAC